ncbi:SAVED domain-containing protein [Endozoicomonas ascidiicola]|uniref:SAVED domain-containing protein n=1 Tax=Endozoicomonas ascidiicola TaxID=1698521 RepID=UPI0012F72986|nr:SAVED domain-containing protein [Endozoicomonas ascidiicola]
MSTRHTAKVFISAMPGVSNDFPSEVLDPTEKEFCREAVSLGLPQGRQEDIDQQVARYNAELEADIFKRFILHEKCQRFYMGGLARVPFLVAYGALLRNSSAAIVYFDKFHREGKWSLLDSENNHTSFIVEDSSVPIDGNGNAGIAIGFTTPVLKEQLPPSLQASTAILKASGHFERNLIKNQENLMQLSTEVGRMIDNFSASTGCKRIHLFLSVQSSFAIELGRRYQEGTQKNWVIHNFNSERNTYEWALELSRHGVKRYEAPCNHDVPEEVDESLVSAASGVEV